MVDVAQLVEHQIVALRVVGSIPTIHPKIILLEHYFSVNLEKLSGRGAIGSALALGARGCQFESGRPDQYYYHIISIFSMLLLCGLLIKDIFPHLIGSAFLPCSYCQH